MSETRDRSRWPLLLIAAPAAVAIWSGWVGLGQMAGFGPVTPLPGISPFRLDTAITLPVGIEAYGAYALGAWLASPGAPDRARSFARRSAVGALLLGMCGQVVFHLLAAAHATRAPWPVVVLVSCVPVVTLGFAAALTHLLRSGPEGAREPVPVLPAAAPVTLPQPGHPAPVTAPALEPWSAPLPERARSTVPVRPRKSARTAHDPLAEFAAELDSGALPSLRSIRARAHVGQERAREILGDLEQAVTERMAMPVNGNGSGPHADVR